MAYRSRESESRTHEQRPTYSMKYRSPFDISGIKEEGKTYAFVRWKTRDQIDPERVKEMLRKGWSFTPIEKFPTQVSNPFETNSELSKYYTVKDTVLMEAPLHYKATRMQELDERSRSKIKALRGISTEENRNHITLIN